jgi:hypothetical protein
MQHGIPPAETDTWRAKRIDTRWRDPATAAIVIACSNCSRS